MLHLVLSLCKIIVIINKYAVKSNRFILHNLFSAILQPELYSAPKKFNYDYILSTKPTFLYAFEIVLCEILSAASAPFV